MKKITLKAFIEQSSIPESLIRAVVKQIGGWDYFKTCAPDVYNYGAMGGFAGFTYYSDTEPFAKNNLDEIIALAEEQAKEFGISGALELIADFGCLRDDKLSQSDIAKAIYQGSYDSTTVLNALAWYALEEVARGYCELAEDY